MKQIPEEFLDRIRQIDILEIAEQYFKLNHMGSIYQTKCIHGGDNDPSLTFFPQTNTFYCFGCGAGKRPKTEGSDVISFVMWLDKCSFMEAVQKIAVMKGWDVPKNGLSKEDKKKVQELEVALRTNRIYWERLQQVLPYIGYLNDRGIGKEEIAKWRIGTVPPAAPRFPRRISFALMNDWGQTVGFSYRNMSDKFEDVEDQGPKYVNSSKSLIFDKGKILYGLNFVKRQIREEGYVIVGEGFGDTILGQKVGLPFVSVMGTSMTDHHINILKQYTNTVILWMDGDGGGINATLRHAKALQKAGFMVKVINYLGKDPDDIFMNILNENENIEEAQAKAKKLVQVNSMFASQFELTQVLNHFDTQVLELKMRACQEVLPILNEIPDDGHRDIYYEMVSSRIDVGVDVLKRGGKLDV
jgi:DNA primase